MKQARLITLLVALLCTVVTWAQDALFQGTVVDKSGEPIVGASVMEKGSSRGSVTDLDGKFSFKGQPGSTLVFSYIGFVTQEKKGSTDMRVTLLEDQKTISEVVVIGYGVQKKSVVTASIAKVDASDLAETAPVRVDNALKGLAAGVNVTSNSGQPGAAARIRVRGTGTINNSDPLYIIDGIPYEGSSGIDALNPNDIESIEVLKDAASGAIYGILLAFGMIFPEERIFIFPLPVPIKAKYFVIGYAAIELFSAMMTSGDGVAHVAHLGGMVFGFFMIRYWRKQANGYGNSSAKDAFDKLRDILGGKAKRGGFDYTRNNSYQSNRDSYQSHQSDWNYNARKRASQEEVDRILDKIRKSGYDSLTKEEKQTLFDQSK